MTPPLTTVNLTANKSTLLFGSHGSGTSPITVINQDATNTVWVGNQQNITVGGSNAIALSPGSATSFDGSVSVYGISSSSLVVAITPGGNSYSPGTLAISGPVTAEISGPVTVNGTVSLAAGTTVDIAGTADVNVQNANIDVIGAGGYILPGQIQAIYNSPNSVSVPGAGGTVTPVNLVDVSTYSSYDFNTIVVDPNMATANHALTFNITLLWYDDLVSGIPIAQEQWNPWIQTAYNPFNLQQGVVGSGPMRGRYMSIIITNTNPNAIAITLEYLNLFGSHRNVQTSDFRQTTGNHCIDNVRTLITNGSSYGYDNSLYDPGVQITWNAGVGTYWAPLNLFSGPAIWQWQVAGAAVISAATIVDVGGNQELSGHIDASIGQVARLPGANGTQATGEVFLPRSACALMVNVGTSGTGYFKLVAQNE